MVCFRRDLVRGSRFGGLFWNESCKRILVWWFVLEEIL